MKFRLAMGLSLLASIWGCGEKSMMSSSEMAVCKSSAFDAELAELIKDETKNEVVQIPQVNELGEMIDCMGAGICSLVEEDQGLAFVEKQKERFRAKGYLLFVFEDGDNRYFVASIKGSDDLDILRWRKTNGINHGHENGDIVAKLAGWKKAFGFVVLGVGMDWTHLKFDRMPDDVAAFANEVYEFCPDSVDQGAGDVESLAEMINGMHGVYLWWD